MLVWTCVRYFKYFCVVGWDFGPDKDGYRVQVLLPQALVRITQHNLRRSLFGRKPVRIEARSAKSETQADSAGL